MPTLPIFIMPIGNVCIFLTEISSTDGGKIKTMLETAHLNEFLLMYTDANRGQGEQGGVPGPMPLQREGPSQLLVQVIDPQDNISLGRRETHVQCAQEEGPDEPLRPS